MPSLAKLLVLPRMPRQMWKQNQRFARRKRSHRNDVPDLQRHDIHRQNIDLIRRISSFRLWPAPEMTHRHAVRIPLHRRARFHLHPPKPVARIHYEIVGIAVPIRLGHRESHARSLVLKSHLGDFPLPLECMHKPLLPPATRPQSLLPRFSFHGNKKSAGVSLRLILLSVVVKLLSRFRQLPLFFDEFILSGAKDLARSTNP